MGDSTGSMFWAFAIFMAIYLLGVAIYAGSQMVKKWLKRRGR